MANCVAEAGLREDSAIELTRTPTKIFKDFGKESTIKPKVIRRVIPKVPVGSATIPKPVKLSRKEAAEVFFLGA